MSRIRGPYVRFCERDEAVSLTLLVVSIYIFAVNPAHRYWETGKYHFQ